MDRVVTANGHELLLTNLEKRFWEPEGYTKLDVISYYTGVSRFLLPHLRDRPQSLRRHPEGAGGQAFFQKNVADIAPPWAETVTAGTGSDGRIRYLLCQDTAALLFMANLGCIEINPWLSRVPHLGRPDFLVLDLDPLGTSFEEVIQVAQVAKDVLDEVGLTGYPKTSGATGLHIYVPVGARYRYADVRTLAEVLAILVHRRLPGITSLERMPAKRGGRVYLDWLQNGEGKTIVAPYSLRAEAGAPVSAPLRWDEVAPGLHPQQFHLGNMPERLARVGDLFAPVLQEGLDLAPLLDAGLRAYRPARRRVGTG